jgi:CRP/FNR family transcriptional regulator, cyclic AMP receptor protein
MTRAGTPRSTRTSGHAAEQRWTVRGSPAQRPRSYQYLFDLDVDLADELDIRMRLAARPSVTATTFEEEPGQLGLAEWLAVASPGPGLLVLDGVIAATVAVGDRMAAELLGGGDLIQPWEYGDAELVCELGWRALVPVRLAVLDGAFVQRVQPWPQIGAALLRRAGRRTRRLDVQRAIAAQPRLEVRLALLMWHLAARWGRVEPGGVRLSLPLTHQLLGRLISAERPSVSHALARLAQAGLLSGHGDDWHLHGSVEQHLATMIEPQVSRLEPLTRALVLDPGSR